MAGAQHLHIALLQINCALANKEINLSKVESLMAGIDAKVTIACLPELFNTGYDLDALGERIFDLAEPVPQGETTQRLASLARKHNVAVVAGLIEQEPRVTGLLYDTTLLIDSQGELVGRYRKSHLYPAEHRYFLPGDDLPVFELDGIRVGVAICFEAAFPPIFSTLAMRGAQLVLNPSAVPVGYEYLQDLRTRARAQDNQYFVVAVNHVGSEGSVTYCGRSQAAGPHGEVITLASGDREQVVLAELDLSGIREQRTQEPVFRGFRPGLYLFKP